MDKLVTIFAPRGRIDYVFKAILLLLVLGAMNWSRDHWEYGAAADTYWDNLWESTVVGFIPTLLALGLISHLKTLQRNLEKAVITDPLTGLPNRRAFFDAVSVALPDPGGVLMMLDADNFKSVNDTYGHGAGDQCLIQISALLRAHLRKCDVVARLGGEEFGLLLVGVGAADAKVIGELLARGVTLTIDGVAPQTVTLSVGAVCTADDDNVAHLLSIADKALYQAKRAGRACIVFGELGTDETHPPVIGPRQVA